MSDIFLSYARSDAAEAKRIATAIEANGWTVWWDRQIPAGQTFDEVIEKELKDAKCVVVVWSRNSVGSNWVKTEADDGLQRGILVPILIDDSEPPFAFRRIQAASLAGWSGPDDPRFEAVTTAIGAVATPGGSSDETRKNRVTKGGWQAEDTHPDSNKKRLRLGAALIGAAAVIGVAVNQMFFGGCDDIECRAQVTRLLDNQETALASVGYAPVSGGQWERDRLFDDTRADHTVRVESTATYGVIAACNDECSDLRVVVTGDTGLEVHSLTTDTSAAALDLLPGQNTEFTISVYMNGCSSQPCDYGLRLMVRPTTASPN